MSEIQNDKQRTLVELENQVNKVKSYLIKLRDENDKHPDKIDRDLIAVYINESISLLVG